MPFLLISFAISAQVECPAGQEIKGQASSLDSTCLFVEFLKLSVQAPILKEISEAASIDFQVFTY